MNSYHQYWSFKKSVPPIQKKFPEAFPPLFIPPPGWEKYGFPHVFFSMKILVPPPAERGGEDAMYDRPFWLSNGQNSNWVLENDRHFLNNS